MHTSSPKGQGKMSAKEYLTRLRLLSVEISNKKKELEECRKLSGIDYGAERVQTSPKGDKLERQALKCLCLEEEIQSDIKIMIEIRHDIIKAIHALENIRYVQILHKRYVEYKSLHTIAAEMKYSYSRIKHLHGDALQAFEKKFLKVDTQ